MGDQADTDPAESSHRDDAEIVDAALEDAAIDDAEIVDAEVVDTDVAEAPHSDDSVEATPEAATDETAEEKIAREHGEYLNALRQLQADFENFRKRSFKQQGDAIDRATGHLVEDLLPVLDACDAAIAHGDEGVTAVFASLLGVLEKAGLERIDPIGETFDPTAHEAVLHEPADEGDDGGEPLVVEVMRNGYKWKERTLRAAMVKVKG